MSQGYEPDIAGMNERRIRNEGKRFLVLVDGRRRWMTFAQAYRALDTGWCSVVLQDTVIDDDGGERVITQQEQDDVWYCANEWSGMA